MRVCKSTYRDKNGKTKKCSKWWIELRDHNRILRHFPGYPGNDRAEKLTQQLGDKIQELINYRSVPTQPPAALLGWLENVSEPVSKRLTDYGLIEPITKVEVKPLISYLADFEQSIKLDALKDRTGKQARQTTKRIKKIIEDEDCKIEYFSDVSGEKIDLYIHRLQEDGMKKQTAQFYVKAFRRFARWMVAKGYGEQYWPVNEEKGIRQGIRHIKVPKSIERAFEEDEYQRILAAARTGPELYGLTGYQRYLLYWTAVLKVVWSQHK